MSKKKTNIYINNKNNKELIRNNLNGIFLISLIYDNYYFLKKKSTIILSYDKSHFKIIQKKRNTYLITVKSCNLTMGIDKSNKITLYDKKDKSLGIYWNLIKINNIEYMIQNKLNLKFIKINNREIILSTNNKNKNNTKFIFRLLKLFDEIIETNSKYLKIIEKEVIDVLIKYIDLSDKTLNRKGIKHIYKDQDNEELKFSLRSILKYIPWIRKIFILMPNEKVKFLKSIDEIKEKIIYVKDKDLLGYDSANIFAFTFNLYKMEKFGISKNYIYMEDDFFIGKPLNKSDFFYYDEYSKKVLRYLITCHFNEMNKSERLKEYYKMFNKKDSFHPHSNKGWRFSILSTERYFIKKYNINIINTAFTHNAIPQNIDGQKEIFNKIQNYESNNRRIFFEKI